MIVYHGSNTVVQHPDVIHTCRNLDFGKGFYVTTVREQAERWAKRKADFAGGTPVVNCYEWNTDLVGLSSKKFGEDLDSWIDFVCDCRDGGEQYLQYDVIIGKVYPTYDQIAFVTQDAINQLLKFVKSEEMKE